MNAKKAKKLRQFARKIFAPLPSEETFVSRSGSSRHDLMTQRGAYRSMKKEMKNGNRK